MTGAYYEIEVEGRLDDAPWRRWFDGMEMSVAATGSTTMWGHVADQAELHGLLEKIRDLGLVLCAVRRLEGASQSGRRDDGRCD